jgi:hypothetical protein
MNKIVVRSKIKGGKGPFVVSTPSDSQGVLPNSRNEKKKRGKWTKLTIEENISYPISESYS